MTDDEIIALAVSHRLGEIEQYGAEPQLVTEYGDIRPNMITFARALIAAEREACAKACEDVAGECDSWDEGGQDGRIAADDCANRIRSRGG